MWIHFADRMCSLTVSVHVSVSPYVCVPLKYHHVLHLSHFRVIPLGGGKEKKLETSAVSGCFLYSSKQQVEIPQIQLHAYQKLKIVHNH